LPVKTRKKRSVKPQGGDFDYLKVKTQKDTNGPAAQVIPEPTRPLETAEVKHRLFHHNGKKPKPKMLRALCFTKEPYGFKETTMEESKLKAAGITPVKDDQGDIYLAVKSKDDQGAEVLSRWPGGLNFPVVTSQDLGMALNWPEIRVIDKARKAGWSKALTMGVWFIAIAVLILIFFLGFFLLGGGKQ
jgi:hypothetical protein